MRKTFHRSAAALVRWLEACLLRLLPKRLGLRGAAWLLLTLLPAASFGADSSVRALNMSLSRGQTNRLSIELESVGSEHSLDFSLCYDPSLLTFIDGVRGSDSTNAAATLDLNLDQIAQGRLGIHLTLPTGTVFDSGPRSILEVLFSGAPSLTNSTTQVSLCGQPVSLQTLDASSTVISSTYQGATVTFLDPCTFTLGATSVNYSYVVTNDTLSVTTLNGCIWTAQSGTNWITVNSSASNTNSGSVSYTVAANPTHLTRTGIIMIDGQNLTITQDPAPCSFTLGFASASYSYVLTNDSVTVSTLTGCVWSVTSGTNWITINSAANNTNSGTVNYTVAANPTHLTRTGTITIDSQNLTVTQDPAPCTFTLGFPNASYSYVLTNDSVTVSTLTGCVWSVTSGTNWITINSAANNTNSGTVSYTVAANPTHLARTGTITIDSQDLTITQDPAPCTFSLDSTNVSYSYVFTNDAISVSTLTGCVWTASSGTSWISIKTGANSTNSGVVSYNVQANPTGLGRTGFVFIADQTVTIVQDPVPCIYNLGFTNINYSYPATNHQMIVSTLTGCVWTAVSGTNWITINSATNNTNSATVSFSVQANPTAMGRTGLVFIAGQVVAMSQDPAPCTYNLGFTNANYSYVATNDQVSLATVTGCVWTVVSGTNWITINSATNNTNSGTVSFSVQANPTGVPRTGLVFIDAQTLTIRQDPAPCTYNFGFTSANYSYVATNDQVSLGTLTGCVWTAVSGINWITVSSAVNNTNSGTVNYSVQANPTGLARTGLVFIAAQPLTIRQDAGPCTYNLGFTSVNYSYVATNHQVTVGASTGCVWTAVSGTNWITINSATNNTNSGTVSYSVQANPTGLARTGLVFIAGQTVTISQDPVPCTYNLGFTSASYSYVATNHQVSVGTLTGCVWTAASGTNWITINSATNNTNSGTVNYSVQANPTGLARTGLVFIAGQTLTIRQDPAPCTYTLEFTAINYSYVLTNDTLSVSTLTGCVWTAQSRTNWITLNSATNNTNSGTMSYTVQANPTGLARTGLVVIAGQTLTVSQDPAPCTYNLGFTSANYSYVATNRQVSVTTSTGCVWTAISGTNWITVNSATNNTNSGTVNFSVQANPTGLARTGLVFIAGQTVTISQDAAPCTYLVGLTNVSYSYVATNQQVNVTSLTGCVWTAVSGTNWITVNSATNNTNSGTVSFSVQANPTGMARTGLVFIAGQILTISQDPAPCTYNLEFTSVNYSYVLTNDTVSVTTLTGCVWTAQSRTNWITLNSATNNTNSGTVSYTVQANPSGLGRTGLVVIAGQTVTITQDPAPCTYNLGFTSVNDSYVATNHQVSVGTLTGCVWTAVSGTNWITVNSATNNTNSGTVSLSVQANPTGLARTGLVFIAGQTVTISQDPAPCTYNLGFTSASYSYVATNHQVSVGTLTGCVWTAVSGTNWITINSATNNTNSGTVSFSVQANPTGMARTGLVFIAGQTLTIRQDPASCSYTLEFTSVNYGYVLTNDTVSVNTLTGCVWTAQSRTNWITLNSATNSTNSSTVSYTVQANPTGLGRTGLVVIAGQTVTITQDPAPCTYNLGFTSVNDSYVATNHQVSVGTLTGCVWTAVSGTNWITVNSATNNTNSGTVSLSVQANPTGLARTGLVFIAGQTVTISQDPAPCTYNLGFTSASYSYVATNHQVSVGTLTGCVWTAVSGTNWITVNSATNNTNSGTVNYSVQANPTGMARTGLVFIAGQTLTIRQDPATCTYTLEFTSVNYSYVLTNDTVSVTTLTGCVWTAQSRTNWITLNSATNNTNSGIVSYTVQANPTGLARTGLVVIAGQTVTITQDPAPCTYNLGFTSANDSYVATNHQVSVGTLTGCVWTAVSGTNWITVNSATNNTNSGTVNLSVQANPTGMARTGLVFIAGQTLTIRQDPAPCTYALGFTSVSYSYVATNHQVSVGTLTGCVWTAASGTNWITINSATNNTNSGTVNYSVQANPTGMARTGLVFIAGQTLTIRQDPAPCAYALGFTSVSYSYVATNHQVSVGTLTGCVWTAASGTNWITISSATNNTNSGTVNYSVQANPTGMARTGLVFVAGQTLTIRQDPAPCTFTFGLTSASYSYVATNQLVGVSTLTGCVWTAVSGTNWITINSATNNTNSGTVSYSVQANPTGLARTGLVFLAGQTVTISQDAAPCTYALGFTNVNYSYVATNYQVSLGSLTGCVWTAVSGTNWISVNSPATNTGSGTVSLSVQANPTGLARTGLVSIAGQTLTISQDAAPCTYSLSFNTANYSLGSNSDQVIVTTLTGCVWTASSQAGWLSITSATSNTNSGTVRYSVQANPTGLPRTGILAIADQLLTVRQDPAPCTFAIAPTNWVHRALSETGQVSVTTLPGCSWNPSTTNDWIVITSDLNNADSGTVGYTLLPNTGASRAGTILIADKIFNVGQVAPGCNYKLSPTNRYHGSGSTTNTVSVTAGSSCSWIVITTNDWLVITNAIPGGTGNGTVGYGLSPNKNPRPRTAVISIGGEALTLTQWGTNCAFALLPSLPAPFSSAGANALVTINASSSTCSWTAGTTNEWIALGGSGGTGGGSLGYTVAPNLSPYARTGYVTIGGELLTVSQAGFPCTYTFSVGSGNYGFTGTNTQVSVTASNFCPWTVSNTNPWVHVTSSLGTNFGSSDVTFTVDPNPTGAPRSGVITIAGQAFGVSQDGAPCIFRLSSSSSSHSYDSDIGSITISSLTGCNWLVSNSNTWIMVTSSTRGSGTGVVSYAIDPNPTGIYRTGLVAIADQVLSVIQAGAPCQYGISPASRAHSSTMETGQVSVTTLSGCPWAVTNSNNWITILSGSSGTDNALVTYRVATNQSLIGRTGTVMVAGRTFTVTQAGAPCSFTISPTTRQHGSGVETGLVTVVTLSGCTWGVSNNLSWVTITSANTNSGTVGYSVGGNASVNSRTGVVMIAGQPFTLVQSGVTCTYALSTNRQNFASPAPASGSVSVITTNVCSWNVINTNNWITLGAITNGTGNGTVNFSVLTNNGPSRTGNLLIAGIPFTVSQYGGLRMIRVVDASIARGQTGAVQVVLESQGNENSIGFSLGYDTNLLSFVSASNLAAGGTLSVNTSQVLSNGRVGFSLALGFNRAFTAGPDPILQLNFSAAPGEAFAATSITNSTKPTTNEVDDVGLNPLSAVYSNATVTLLGLCNYALSTNSASFTSSGSTGVIGVTSVHPTCLWTVSNDNSWITINSSTNGAGNGSVTYTVAANLSGVARSGVFTVAGLAFTVNQAAATCSYSFLPTAWVHGPGPETGLVAVTAPSGCPWSASTTNAWIILNSGTNGSGDGVLGYSVLPNPSSIARTGLVTIASQPYTVTQLGAACVYTLSLYNGVHGAGVETGSVSVIAIEGCRWGVINTNDWITVPPAYTNGVGTGIVTYVVAANPNLNARAGVLTIGGQTFTVSQIGADCAFTVSPGSFFLNYFATNGFIAVGASSNGCGWNIVNTNAWITTSVTNGIGNLQVGFTVGANGLGTARVGTLNIGGQTVTFNQAGSPCVFSLTPSGFSCNYFQTNAQLTVNVFSTCGWNVSASSNWIVINSSVSNNVGSRTVSYTVLANPTALQRAGTLMIADQVFPISQAPAPCTFALSANNVTYSYIATNTSVNVISPLGCVWGVSNPNSWITISPPAGGNGNGVVNYSLLPNPISIGRTGVVTIAGQTLAIVQAGAPCTYSISPNVQNYGSGPTNGAVTLTTIGGCVWGVTNTNAWINILSSTNNNVGSGSVNYNVTNNPAGVSRTGVVVIAGQPLTIIQGGAPCNFLLSPNNPVYQSGPTNDSISVGTLFGCTWGVTNTNPWITITSSTNGSGQGTVTYTVANNPIAIARTGVVMIAGQPVTVAQLGAPCTYVLTPIARDHGSGSESGSFTVSTITGCNLSVVNPNSWVSILSATNGLVSYTVDANPTTTNRTGVLTIGEQHFTINQAGLTCNYSIIPTSHIHGFGTETLTISIVTSNGCPWTASESTSWIIPKSATNGIGLGTFKYNVSENVDPVGRTGIIAIANQIFTVVQVAAPCSFNLSATGHIHTALVETGMVSVVTGDGCSWDVTTTNDWITPFPPTNGLGFANISYSISPNLTPFDRIGYLMIATQMFTIYQIGAGCTYGLIPGSSPVHPYAGDTGVVALATFSGCNWSVTKTAPWITINPPTSGSGPTNFSYTVATNPTALVRTGFLTVLSTNYLVTQGGAPCTFALSASNRFHGPLVETGSVSVLSLVGCNWSVSNLNSWIRFPAGTNGTGGTNLTYIVTNNPVAFPRTGTVMIAGLPYVVTQAAATCTYTLSPTNRLYSYFATNGTVSVTTVTGCTWVVGNSNSWINVTSSLNNSNSGSVIFTVTNNPTGLMRTGVVNIAGQPFPIVQSNAPCTFILSPSIVVLNSGPNSGSVNLNSLLGCNWTINNTNPWIAVIGGTNGSGSATVSYTVQPNPNPTARVGFVTIAGQTLIITNLSGVAITCVTNKNVECGAAWDFDQPTAYSSCGGNNVTVQILGTVTNSLGACGSTYTAIRTWQATDTCNNTATCSQTVRIVDTTPPTVNCVLSKTVEFGSVWFFDSPTATDICSGPNVTFEVIRTVTNTAGFCGNTFTATRTWEGTDACGNTVVCSQTVNVVDSTPPILICSPDKGVICTNAWTFDPPIASDLASGTNLTIVVVGTVTNAGCGPNFMVVRTWRATDLCGNSSTCSQTIFNAQVTISGTVSVPATYPASSPSALRLGGVTMKLSGDASKTTKTAGDGSYSFVVNALGNYSVTPDLPNSTLPSNGVSTVDISLIRRHILIIPPETLDSPFKLLAADVNGSGANSQVAVSTFDISFIRRVVLDPTNVFPAGLWRLIPADYVFPDPLNPWNAPATRSYSNLSTNRSGQDFWAVKIGDVNNSWTPPAGLLGPAPKSLKSAQIAGPEVVFQASSHTNQPGDVVTVQISSSEFRQVTSAQFTLAWNPAVLQFAGIGNYGLNGIGAGNFNALLTNSGKLAFSWDDPAAMGVTLPDGAVLFTLNFEAVGKVGSSSPIEISDSLAQREVGVNFATGNFISQDGLVTVGASALVPLSQPSLPGGFYTKEGFSVQLPTLSGRSYILEYTDVLPGTNWIALPAVIGDGTLKILSDPGTNGQQRFYRLRIE